MVTGSVNASWFKPFVDSLMWSQILTMSLLNMKVNNSDLVVSIKMQIKYKSLSRACLISYHSGDYKKDREKRSGRNRDQPNEYSWAGRSKNNKNNDTLSVPAVLWIVSVCQGKYR